MLWLSLPLSFEGGTRVAERLGKRNLTKSEFPAAVVQPPPFLPREAKGSGAGKAKFDQIWIPNYCGSDSPFPFEGSKRVAGWASEI